MGRFSWLVIACAACGRVGFDPLGLGGDDGPGSGTDGHPGTAPPGDVCATAIDIQLGVTLSDATIDDANDDYPAGFCGNGPDLVLRVSAPSSGQRFASAVTSFDLGLMASASCPPPVGSCSKIGAGQGSGVKVSIDLEAGVNYIVVDRVAGTGTTFSITVE